MQKMVMFMQVLFCIQLHEMMSLLRLAKAREWKSCRVVLLLSTELGPLVCGQLNCFLDAPANFHFGNSKRPSARPLSLLERFFFREGPFNVLQSTPPRKSATAKARANRFAWQYSY
jgi:hypothetical protein